MRRLQTRLTPVSVFEQQQARKRAEIDYGPWPARLAWLKKSRLVEERRALRYNARAYYPPILTKREEQE